MSNTGSQGDARLAAMSDHLLVRELGRVRKHRTPPSGTGGPFDRVPLGQLSDGQLLAAFADRLERNPTLVDLLLSAGVRIAR